MAVELDTTTSWDITDDASARALAQAIHDALVGVGLVQTADTGQLDLSGGGPSYPGSEGDWGYRVYRFDDAEQATNPIFIRITFRRGDSMDEFRLAMQVGKGTNGSGSLTDAATGTSSTTAGAGDSANREITASFIDGALHFAASANPAGWAFHLLVERGKDFDGEFDGTVLACVSADSQYAGGLWDGSTWQALSTSLVLPCWNPTPGAGTRAPITQLRVGGMLSPVRMIALVHTDDYTVGGAGLVEIDGEEREYRVGQWRGSEIGISTSNLAFNGGSLSGTSLRLLIRDE